MPLHRKVFSTSSHALHARRPKVHRIKLPAGLLCTLLAVSCAGPPAPGQDTLRIAFEAAPAQFDPRFATDAYSQRVLELVCASLVTIAPDGSHRPYVADHWTYDGDQIRFHLSPSARFHDGSPILADDVVATYRSILDPATGSPHRASLDAVAEVRAASDRAVVFRLSRPDAAFLDAATVGLLPARLAGHEPIGVSDLVGSGPYRIAAIEADGSVRLEAATPPTLAPPVFKTLEIRVIPDTLMRALAYQHGTIDFIQNALDPDTLVYLERREPAIHVYRGHSSNVQYLGLRFDHPLLGKRLVRRALALAIDRQAITRHLLRGQARLATGILPPEHWAYSGRVRRYRYRPQRARHLLDRAGLVDPDGPGPALRATLSYKTTTQELPRRIAEAIAAQLTRVGIGLSIETYEWGTFYGDIRKGSFDLYSLQWVGITDPDIYRRIFHSAMSPPAGANRGRYRNRRMDRLTTRGALASNRKRRQKIYARVQRLAARDLPMIPLWWPERIVVSRRDLGEFVPEPAGGLLPLARLTRNVSH